MQCSTNALSRNDRLRANGHVIAEVPLQPPETAVTLYWKNGKVATTDGPYEETREQLRGISIIEARDSIMPFSLSHSLQALSMDLDRLRYGRLRI